MRKAGFSFLVRLAGIEPTTPWFVAKYSIQLSYSRQALNSMLEISDSMNADDFFFRPSAAGSRDAAMSALRGYDLPMCSLHRALPHTTPVLRRVALRACTLGTSGQQAGKTGQYCPGLAADH